MDDIKAVGRPLLLIKCMEKKYIEQMYKKGIMRMSCPGKWILGEKKGDIGRGDKNDEADHVYYQLHTVIGCPTYCFYVVEDADLLNNCSVPDENGLCDVEVFISGKFFEDFSNAKGLTEDQIKKLPEEERPALLIISNENIYTFFYKAKETLKKKLHIADANILIDKVNYAYNRYDSEFECPKIHPYELFYKNEELSYQKEARLVVYERKYKLKKYETDYLDIQIGSMESYSEIHESYTPDGMVLKLKVKASKVGEMLKRDGKILTGYDGKELEIEKE